MWKAAVGSAAVTISAHSPPLVGCQHRRAERPRHQLVNPRWWKVAHRRRYSRWADRAAKDAWKPSAEAAAAWSSVRHAGRESWCTQLKHYQVV
jgi:hypothetical protein